MMLFVTLSVSTLVSLVSGFGAVQDERCEDCQSFVSGLLDASFTDLRCACLQIHFDLQN